MKSVRWFTYHASTRPLMLLGVLSVVGIGACSRVANSEDHPVAAQGPPAASEGAHGDAGNADSHDTPPPSISVPDPIADDSRLLKQLLHEIDANPWRRDRGLDIRIVCLENGYVDLALLNGAAHLAGALSAGYDGVVREISVRARIEQTAPGPVLDSLVEAYHADMPGQFNRSVIADGDAITRVVAAIERCPGCKGIHRWVELPVTKARVKFQEASEVYHCLCIGKNWRTLSGHECVAQLRSAESARLWYRGVKGHDPQSSAWRLRFEEGLAYLPPELALWNKVVDAVRAQRLDEAARLLDQLDHRFPKTDKEGPLHTGAASSLCVLGMIALTDNAHVETGAKVKAGSSSSRTEPSLAGQGAHALPGHAGIFFQVNTKYEQLGEFRSPYVSWAGSGIHHKAKDEIMAGAWPTVPSSQPSFLLCDKDISPERLLLIDVASIQRGEQVSFAQITYSMRKFKMRMLPVTEDSQTYVLEPEEPLPPGLYALVHERPLAETVFWPFTIPAKSGSRGPEAR